MPITDVTAKNAKPQEKLYKIKDEHGMFLSVRPNGGKYWQMNYRFAGKGKTLSFGVYPEVTIKEARDKREAARKLLREGIDPSQAKKKEKLKAVINTANSFEVIAREWHSTNADKWSEGHCKNILHRLEMDIFPQIGNYPIADITPPELLNVLRQIEKRGAHEIAHRAKQTCGQIFRYAIVTGRAVRDPSADLKDALKPAISGHYSALDSKDLPDFLKALERNEARLYPQTRLAVQLLLLTFVRTSELINATWEEIDLDNALWTIPGARMKMGKDHLVPLSKQVLAMLKEQKELTGQWNWVFPSVVSPRKAMSNNTILGAIRRLGYKDKTTGHGFRALAMSTIKEKLGYRHEVVDRQLAHAPVSKVDRAYDRAQFIDERKKMMQEWSDYLDRAAVGGSNVIEGRFKIN